MAGPTATRRNHAKIRIGQRRDHGGRRGLGAVSAAAVSAATAPQAAVPGAATSKTLVFDVVFSSACRRGPQVRWQPFLTATA
jgi:hypothetical protein